MKEVRLPYPEPKPWAKRARSIQYIPEGSQGIATTLRIIFKAVQDELSPDTILEIPGSDYKATLGDVCTRIRPAGLTEKVDKTWRLTEESIAWLDNESNNYLAAILCANVMFMSEQLAQMQSPKSTRELWECATEYYGMAWKGLKQVRARNYWFRALGFVRYHESNQKYELTGDGRAFLATVEILSPEEVMEEKEMVAPKCEEPSEWALRLCDMPQEQLASRESPLACIPGGSKELVDTISVALSFLVTPLPFKEFDNHLKEVKGINKSSSAVLRGELKKLGLTQKTAKGIALTEKAQMWLEERKPVDLACIVHASRRYVFEIIKEVDAGASTRQEIGNIAKAKYQVNLTEDNLSARINYLERAGLLIQSSSILEATDASRGLLDNVRLESVELRPESQGTQTKPDEASQQSQLVELLCEIRDASLDSANAKRFELACVSAFEYLGFRAEHRGGSGDTDVLVETQCISQYAYKVAVDAKSSSKGYIADNDVNFDSLDAHRDAICKDNGLVTYSVVVAPGFGEGRIRNNAVKHNVLLLDVDTLSELIRKHADIPLTSADYRALFESSDIAKLETLDPYRNAVRARGLLLRDIMSTMLDVSDDDDGLFGEKELGRSIRRYRGSKGGAEEAPDAEEIKQALAFLSSPVVGILKASEGKVKEYHAKCSAEEASRLLSYFSRAVGEQPT